MGMEMEMEMEMEKEVHHGDTEDPRRDTERRGMGEEMGMESGRGREMGWQGQLAAPGGLDESRSRPRTTIPAFRTRSPP
jgi:hypothetical protein